LKKEIVIYGAGGLGREMLSMLSALPQWEVKGFYDDGIAQGTIVKKYPVLGGLEALLHHQRHRYVVLAMGDPVLKARVAVALAANHHLEFPVLLHPQAIIQDRDSIFFGSGAVLTAGVIITTDVEIGDHVLLNLNCTIGHDVTIGECSSLMPGVNIAGGVTIGQQVMIGSGANILNGITLGDGVRIGSGAVVTKDVLSGDTVVGVPAKKVEKKPTL
jgi:sugar O-acyltransferase (sialic acid O-acetyltransferase NeuD family)